MNIQSETALTPKLRFPEFSGDWEEKNIGKVLTIGSGKDYKHLGNGNIPVYGTGENIRDWINAINKLRKQEDREYIAKNALKDFKNYTWKKRALQIVKSY